MEEMQSNLTRLKLQVEKGNSSSESLNVVIEDMQSNLTPWMLLVNDWAATNTPTLVPTQLPTLTPTATPTGNPSTVYIHRKFSEVTSARLPEPVRPYVQSAKRRS
jgi:hypothetical protein